jgi:hypothetical protein
MNDDLANALTQIEQLPLEQRADAYQGVYDQMKNRLEQVDAQRPSA